MRTRSQARRRRQPQVRQTSVESSNLEKPDNPPIVTMADNRTMAQLLEAPTEGYEDAIVIPEITANNFEIKHGLLNLVQNKQFFGHDKEDPHAHIRYFNKITSTMKIPNVPNTSVKLMLFPFSLEGAARIWLEKEPPRSIETWDDLVSKFINKFFPPSKTTNLRNEITRFQQKFDETFYEAWDRFNDLLRAAGGTLLRQKCSSILKIIESKSKVRQSRNKAVVAKMSTSSSTQAVSSDVAELKDMVRALILDRKNQTPASAPVKAVEQSCVTCGGGHSYQNCPATNSNMYHDNIQEYVSQAAAANFNQANSGYRPPMVSNQIRPPGFPPVQNPHANSQNNFNRGNNFNQNRGNNFNQGQIYRPPVHQPVVNQPVAHQGPAPQTHGVSKTDFERYVTANDAVLRNMQNQGQNLQSQMANLTDMLSKFVTANTASTSGSGTLPGNTITNPKEDLKGITTRSGVTIQGPKAFNHDTEVTKDTMPPANNGSTEDVQPPVVQIQSRNPNPEPNVAPVVTPVPKASIPFPSRRNDERRKEKANDQIEKFYEIFRDLSFEISFTDALMLMPKFASTLKTLIGNKEKLSELARTPLNENCSAVILNKSRSSRTNPNCSMTLELADRSITEPIGIAKDVRLMVGKFQFPADFVVVDFEPDPRVPLILGRCFLKTSHALIDVYEGEITLRVGKEAITFNLDQTSKYTADYNHMTVNKIDVIDMACDEYSQEVLGFSNVIASGNPTPYFEPIVSTASPNLTPFGDSDFLLMEEADSFLALEDDPTSSEVDPTYQDPEGDILLLEAILNSEPPPLPNHEQYMPGGRKELKLCEAKTVESSVNEPPEVELKELPPHLEYAFLEGDDKLPVIIAKDLKDEEKQHFSGLRSHKRAIAWKLSDIKGVSPEFSLGGARYTVYLKRRKLNEATRKDHFPLPFMDQMLERLAGNEYYCFLDGFSGYFQIPIDPKDQEKTTFTCPYGTFAYRRMPFGLCNAPGTFQRCMMAIFHDMIEKTMEVFMDDFSVFGDSFSTCLTHLEKMLKRCEDTNLSLNWEKSHFMVKEGIVLGHKISKSGLEVDRAKVEVIAKLPHPTSVKGVRSFLGHAGFYRRFIQDFSKIARPMTHLLEKETPFVFSEECVDSFNTLKRRLTEAPILIAPDWDLPFELMCDASDFAIGAVLGQRKNKHFQPIHYASKTMNEAQTHYTTTEKELLAVVYAFEKFRSYLVMSKSIVYTDHSAIKYLFAKKDAKARLMRWILLLQEFDIEIRDKKGAENLAAQSFKTENPHQDSSRNKEITEGHVPLENPCGIYCSKDDVPMTFSTLAKLDYWGHYGANYTQEKIFDSGFLMATITRNAMTLYRCAFVNVKEKLRKVMSKGLPTMCVLSVNFDNLFSRYGARAIIVIAYLTFAMDQFTKDFPDCEDSRACSISHEFHILSFSLGIQIGILRTGEANKGPKRQKKRLGMEKL
ncbi:reverse transcriptase domain-containing protein [Tanacetum coccineum]|uniref:RNA-directed DNA polymerase n=1 Tax=Tanacetum coccineum TaxID=301880 RepID=A0ABQ5I4Z0_9ASTR